MSEAKRQSKTRATTGGISSASGAKTTDAPVTEATSKFCWNWAVIFPEALHRNPNFPIKPEVEIGLFSVVADKEIQYKIVQRLAICFTKTLGVWFEHRP